MPRLNKAQIAARDAARAASQTREVDPFHADGTQKTEAEMMAEASAAGPSAAAAAKPSAKPASAPAKTGATVTVALKHPTGIFLEAFEPSRMQVPDGVGRLRDETIFRSTGKRFEVHGNRVPFGATPNFPIVAGFALTHGVPKDLWETWLKQHADSDLVQNRLISAFDDGDSAADYAKDHEGTKSGMEAMLRVGDPRADKKKNRDGKFVDAIVQADEQPAAV